MAGLVLAKPIVFLASNRFPGVAGCGESYRK